MTASTGRCCWKNERYAGLILGAAMGSPKHRNEITRREAGARLGKGINLLLKGPEEFQPEEPSFSGGLLAENFSGKGRRFDRHEAR